MKKCFFYIVFLMLLVCGQSVEAAKNKKIKVIAVEIAGNTVFSDHQILKLMITRPSSFFSRVYYYPNLLEDDLHSLVLFYQQNGHLEVQVQESKVAIDTLRQTAHIYLNIAEGELTRIEGISQFGNSLFSETELMEKIKLNAGDPLSHTKVQNAKLAVLTLYANSGYLDAEVNVDLRVNSETHSALIDFIIQENSQYTIGNIVISGLEKTKENVVLRELLFKEGDVVRYAQLLRSQRKLYLTGLFQSVFIRPQPDSSGNPGKKQVLIELKENLSGEFNLAAGYGSVEKIRGRIELYNTNLLGTARKLSLATKASFIARGVEASFTEPWTFGIPWRSDLNLLIDYLKEPGFEVNRVGRRLVIGRNFTDRSTISLTYRFEDANFKKIKVSKIPEKLKTDVRSLMLSIVIDTRDNIFNSSRGTYFEWSNEMAGSFLSGSNTFARAIWRYRYFYPSNRAMIIASSFEIGWMNLFGGSKEIPLTERFYTGGPNSLRGFGYRLVGPLDNLNIPLGGKFKLVWNALEVRRVLYRMIGGALFMDVGNVWSEPEYVNLKDLRTSVGVGIRVNTPLGIVRVDYSYNVQPKPGESRTRLYLNMGQAF